jgi:hypothetical protein
LALIVNGLYFISLFTPTEPHTRPRYLALRHEVRDLRAPARTTPIYVSLPPRVGPSKAETYTMAGHNQLDVYLKNDLTLVKRPGYRLLLSPAFTTTAAYPEPPDTVLLRFVTYTNEPINSNTYLLAITADGRYVWDENVSDRYAAGRASEQEHSVGDAGGDEVVETVGVNLPYEVFAEIIRARQVTIQFGPDRFELSAEEVEALRDLHRCLSQGAEAPPPEPLLIKRPRGGGGMGVGIGSGVGQPAPVVIAPSDARPPAKSH